MEFGLPSGFPQPKRELKRRYLQCLTQGNGQIVFEKKHGWKEWTRNQPVEYQMILTSLADVPWFLRRRLPPCQAALKESTDELAPSEAPRCKEALFGVLFAQWSP